MAWGSESLAHLGVVGPGGVHDGLFRLNWALYRFCLLRFVLVTGHILCLLVCVVIVIIRILSIWKKSSVFILMLNIFCYVMLPLLISLRDIYCFHTGKLLSLSDNLLFPHRIVSVWDIYSFLMGYLIFPCGRFILSSWNIYSFFIWYLLFPHGIFPYQIFTFSWWNTDFFLTGYLLFSYGIFPFPLGHNSTLVMMSQCVGTATVCVES